MARARLDDELARAVKAHADAHGRSVNSWVVAVLDAAVNPALEDSELGRTRARLERAGLLGTRRKGPSPTRPGRGRVAKARRRSRNAAVATRVGRARLSVFCDSSALVKLYADEPGADRVRRLPSLVVSAMARAEVPAAVWRRHRLGELSADAAAVLEEQFLMGSAEIQDEPMASE